MQTPSISTISILGFCLCSWLSAATNTSGAPMIRGVNLGGWLVLEPWITPDLFETANQGVPRQPDNRFSVVDEYTWRTAPKGDKDRFALIMSHWKSWVLYSHLQTLRDAGITHLRIPVGYWYFHYRDGDPFAVGAWDYGVALGLLKQLVNDWAPQLGLKVLIDLHTAPGSQNGFDNSGKRGTLGFQDQLQYWREVLDYMTQWCDSNLDKNVLFGIEIMNEPAGWIDNVFQTVKDYVNPNGYAVVRSHTGVNVFLSTAFRTYNEQADYVRPYWHEVWFDDHNYRCFGDDFNQLALKNNGWDTHLASACAEKTKYSDTKLWSVVGEWSLAVTDCAKYVTNGMNGGCDMKVDPECKYRATPERLGSPVCNFYNQPVTNMPSYYKDFLRKFALAQMDTFETANGWFFWNFRTENGHAPEWDYLLGLQHGWIPANVAARQPYCSSADFVLV